VRLIGRPQSIKNTQDGLFIECKPVDSAHAVLAHYCAKGLARFIRGEYAWAMTNAMMVGYTRVGYTIPLKLKGALQGWPLASSDGCMLRSCTRSEATAISEIVHLTDHDRDFKYMETQRKAPRITIRHLWLNRD
jgi:hypothetical protein